MRVVPKLGEGSGARFVTVGKSKSAQWAKKGSIAHVNVKTNPINLIWSYSDR